MKKTLLLYSSLLLLTSCKVGPNYYPPETATPPAFIEEHGERTTLVSDDELVGWWRIFNDSTLDQLLKETESQNYDYLIAIEKICQARANYWTQFTQLLPDFESDVQATRFRSSQSLNNAAALNTITPAGTTISPYQSFFQIGLDAIWELDIFGGQRRATTSAYNLWEEAEDNAWAVKILVLSEVASIYSNVCYYQTKVNIASELVEIDEKLLQLSTSRNNAGLVNEQELNLFKSTLESDIGALKALEIQYKQTIYSLAVLTGITPDQLIELFATERAIPRAEYPIPVSLPSDLLRRRPDIRASERALASATEEIGVAVADLFPRLSLVGSSSSFAGNPLQGANVGFASNSASKLFSSGSRTWGIGGIITWPVFDFGRRRAIVDIQSSLANQAYLSYQKYVMTALQETEQALSAYFYEEERHATLSLRVLSNEKSWQLDRDLYNSGLLDYAQSLQAKASWLRAMNDVTDSRIALTIDLITLYRVLGGEW